MSEHKASIQWKLDTENFNIKTNNRNHEVRFVNCVIIPVSAAIGFDVNSQLNNREDLIVTYVMSCHMQTYFWQLPQSIFF